jgi:signal transduction histidine kinase
MPRRHGTYRVARLDVAIVVALAVYGQLEAWSVPGAKTAIAGPPVLNALAFLVASTALLWRRHAPVTVLLVEAANLAALSVLAGGSEALGWFVPVLVAIYSAARYAASVWRAVAALGVLAGALLLHDLRDPQVDQAADVVVFWLVLAAAWPVGAAIRRWSDRNELLAAEVAAREARARSEERARIARELHDVVSHSLGVMLVQAEAATRSPSPATPASASGSRASAAAAATPSATCDASLACCATRMPTSTPSPSPGPPCCPT